VALSKQYLALTAISDFWNTDLPIVFLGPWCLVGQGNNKLSDPQTCLIVPSPWKPAVKVREAADRCGEVYNNMLPKLSEQLNFVHGVDYSQSYWRVLVGPWLKQFIEILYERYIRLDNSFKLFPDVFTYIMPEALSKSISIEKYDSISAQCFENDFYNLKLFSLIIRKLYPARGVEKNITMPVFANRSAADGKIIKKAFYALKRIKNTFKHPDIILSDMYHFDFRQILSLEEKSCTHPVSFENFDTIRNVGCPDLLAKEKRNRIKLEIGSGGFLELLGELLPMAIPRSYVENFQEYKKKSCFKEVKAVGSAVGWCHNEKFKFFAAETVSLGTKLLSFQQGGGYGMALASPVEDLGLEGSIFYAWKCNSDGSRTRILPSPHFSKLVDSYFAKRDNILFVGTSVPKYSYRFNSTLFPDDMLKYFEDKRVFLKGLPSHLLEKIAYRPYHYEYGWGENDFIKSILPEVIFLSQGKLTKHMQQAKLVVIDHAHTSFLEALVINVPVILYWDHRVHLMLPEAEKYFDLLRNAGILHQDPASASRRVSEIFDDPLAWWSKDEVQNARLRFCEHFVGARKDWLQAWLGELKNMVETQR